MPTRSLPGLRLARQLREKELDVLDRRGQEVMGLLGPAILDQLVPERLQVNRPLEGPKAVMDLLETLRDGGCH